MVHMQIDLSSSRVVGDQLGDFTNCNGLSLVTVRIVSVFFLSNAKRLMRNLPKREAAKLRVILETLDTEGASRASNAESRDDRHALCSKAWCLLALPACSLLELVEQSAECDFFLGGVDVENTVVTRSENTLNVQENNLCFK